MCRHIAYLGPERSLYDLLLAPAHSLVRMACAPRHQAWGDANPDGYGIGWYDASGVPQRDRHAEPIWDDAELTERARGIHTTAALAAVRLASPGSPVEVASNAPYLADGWLFSLNGAVTDYHEGVGARLRNLVSGRRAAGIEGSADSGVLFALALDQLDAGATPGAALHAVLHQVVGAVGAGYGGRLNFLLTDGRRVAGTTWGNSLFVRQHDAAVTLASEPLDEDATVGGPAAWRELPDHTLVEATATQLTMTPLSLAEIGAS